MSGDETQQPYGWRRSLTDDASDVERLIEASRRRVEARFGSLDIPLLLETVAVPVTITATDGSVCGFAAFSNVAPPWARAGATLGIAAAGALPQQRALWAVAFAADPLRESKAARAALRAAFVQCPDVDEVFLALPRSVPHNESPFLALFADSRATPRGVSLSEGSVRILSCSRAEHVPKLVVRTARVEDHDDLVPIFNEQSDLDTRLHDSFFLARVIENQNATNVALVAEHSNGRAAGIACVSADVQRAELSDAFLDLAAFTGETDSSPELQQQRLLEKAVCVTLFCLKSEYSHRAGDFLTPIFERFPDKDYLLLTQPFTSPTAPLLQHFVQVPPRPHSTFGHVLYVLTRAAFVGAFSLRQAVQDDIEKAVAFFQRQALLSGTILPPPFLGSAPEETTTDLEKTFRDALDSEGRRVPYLVVSNNGGDVLGAAVVDRLDTDGVRPLFEQHDLDTFVPGLPLQLGEEYGRLSLLSIDPRFQTRTIAILGALMAAPSTALLLEVESGRDSGGAMLGSFYRVRMRRQPSPREATKEPQKPALFVCTSRLLMEPKTCINNRIVVVGASAVGVSLIDTLLGMQSVLFPHITLISPEGVPDPEPHLSFEDCSNPLWAPLACRYFSGELQSNAVHSRVRVCKAKLVEIDRSAKVAFLSDDQTISYDQLILAVGQQAAVPQDVSGVFAEPRTQAEGAEGIAAFLGSLGRTARAVVYGQSISALAVVSSLRSLDVPLSVTLVRPPSESPWPVSSGDEVLIKAVSDALAAAQVEVFEPFTLTNLDVVPDTGVLTSVQISREEQLNTVPCDLLVVCEPKQTDPSAFEAINMCCLVYDGKLVVDKDFATNDPSIFSAGSLTKYSRPTGDTSSMAMWNSREVGQQLAAAMLSKTGHFADGVPLQAPKRTPHGTILFTSPICEGTVLPDGTFYYHCQLPVLSPGGRTLATHPSGKAYLALHSSAAGLLDSITYIGKERPCVDNLRCLLGLPHTVLNNVAERFDAGLVPDLAAFLREPWAQAIFHDRFGIFLEDLCNTLQTWLGPAASDLQPLDAKALGAVSEYLASFIATNQAQLPQYAVPSL